VCAILVGMTDAAGTPRLDPQRPDPQRPDPQRPDPQRPDPQRPDPQRFDLQRPLEEGAPVHDGTPGPLRAAAPEAPATDAVAPAPAPAPAPAAVRGAIFSPARWVATGRRTGRALGHVPMRAVRAMASWSRRPAGRLALPAVTVLGMIGVAATAGAFVVPAAAPTAAPDPIPSATPAPVASPTATGPTAAPPVPPTGGATGAGRSGIPSDVLRGWAQQMSVRTDIPVVALQAYGYAELVLAETTPGCQLSWTTLAAIGRVESDHGRTGGATLGADGRADPPIIGPPLDGQGDRRLIEDTDGGAIDGDDVYDRAVGPMQFIPQTWLAEQVDATGDGIADPHNIHDAALAAANYLCGNNRDLTSGAGWWEAVLAYNNVLSYAEQVHAAANEYGLASHG
jgi:hypothetical protein